MRFGKTMLFPRAGRWCPCLAAVVIGMVVWGPAMASPMDAPPPWFSRSWLTDDGLPDNNVTGLVQTSDGYLWVGTLGGLMRFNGADFTSISLPRVEGVSPSVVRAVFRDSKDRLWIGMERGRMMCLDGGDIRTYGPEDGLPPHMARSFSEDSDGNLWIASESGISRLRDGKIRHFGPGAGLGSPRGNIQVVAQADGSIAWLFGGKLGVERDGKLVPTHQLSSELSEICAAAASGVWVCERGSLRRFSDGVISEELARLPEQALPRAMLEDGSGALWIGTASNGLFRMENGRLESVPTSHGEVNCLFEDREGNLWAGTAGGGLNQIRPRVITLINRQAGLPSDSVRSVTEDSEGGIWAAFENGRLARFSGGQWTDVGLPGMEATCVSAHPDGSVWVGSRGMGLRRMYEGRWQTWQRPEGLAQNDVRSILVARDEKVWIASEFPLRLQYFHEGRFHGIAMPPDFDDVRPMRAITEAADGTIWVGTARGELMRVVNDKLVRESPKGERTLHSIRTLQASPDGGIWIGHAGTGLGFWKDGARSRITTDQGLRENHVAQMLADRRGSLWMAGNRGLSVVRIGELDAVFEGRESRLRARAFGRAEGLPGLQATFNHSPSAWEGRDGRLWFAMRGGILMVRPGQVRDNPVPPPVVLERVAVDERTIAAYGNTITAQPDESTSIIELVSSGDGLRLHPRHNKLEFEFAALSFTSPENVHFRYRLRGFDQNWIEADGQRRAAYPRLPDGTYEFQVIACNHAGVWNETGASIRVVVDPFYWQTWWFRVLSLFIFTVSIIAMVRYVSFRRLRENMRELEQQAALHRERARIARDMHDEVGAKLTRLSLLSDMAAAAPALPPETGADVREISDTARETILAFDEIVWAVNPRNDSLADLAGYLCRHAEDFFEGSPTECIFDLPATIPPVMLATETRHEVFLAAKEALTNVAKYAAASRVRLRLLLLADAFEIIIEDDGRGFDPAAVAARPGGGNGLPNMRERMRRNGGSFECLSHPGGGTLIKFHVPYAK